jgi:hypothetical protein
MFDLHDLMMDLTPGDGVTVQYDSKRADGARTMEGEVVECVVRDEKCRLRFRRDDGQMCVIRGDGALLSLGSNRPHTGDVMAADIIEGYADVPYLQRYG